MVLLAADGIVQWTSSLARQWFAAYFGSPHGAASELPEAIGRWLRAHARSRADEVPAPPTPLVVRRDHAELTIRFVRRGPHALLLVDEQYLAIPPDALRGLGEVQVTVLTPFPGTRLYERLRNEGRLLRDRYWERCTLFDVNFRPAHMSPEALQRNLVELAGRLYTEDERVRRRRAFHEHRRRFLREARSLRASA